MGVLAYLNPLSYRRKSPPSTDYETILSRLSVQITEAKSSLSEIRLRERRLALLLNTYGALGWLVFVALVWFDGVPWGLVGVWGEELGVKVLEWGMLALGPVGLLLFNRLLHTHFTRRRLSEELHLRKLLTKQNELLEEIKKKSRYYETRELLERYDASGSGSGALGGGGTPKRTNQSTPTTPSSPSPAQGSRAASGATPASKGGKGGSFVAGAGQGGGIPGRAGGGDGGGGSLPLGMTPEQASLLRMQQQGQMLPMLPTPQKKWYDHLADKLMGDDPSQAAQTQYALVCGGCFRHNGLVGGGKAEWEKLQWICPRCGYFNPAPNSRNTMTGLPPSGPFTPSPAPSTMLASSPQASSSSARESKSLRQRGGKVSGSAVAVAGTKSSGLKEVISAEDYSQDDMDVDEPDDDEEEQE